jgi:EpsI family protein
MLAIAYGGQQTDTLKAHRQEVCYAAQGFAIRAVSPGSLHVAGRNIPVTRVLAVKGARSEPLTYWFTMGDRVVLSRFERLMVQLKFGLAGEIPDGMLVRVSNLSSQADQAYATHAEFANALLGAMRAPDVARLTGAFGA